MTEELREKLLLIISTLRYTLEEELEAIECYE